jgi:hypothetical protein
LFGGESGSPLIELRVILVLQNIFARSARRGSPPKIGFGLDTQPSRTAFDDRYPAGFCRSPNGRYPP